jgi:C1A family cysteine protease
MISVPEINEAIAREAPGSWVAAETPVWLSSRGETRGTSSRFGLRLGPRYPKLATADADEMDDLAMGPPPTAVDWRSRFGGRVTAIHDQTTECASCVAFAVCAAMESAHWIAIGSKLDLSEAHLFFCNGGDCRQGWDFLPALEAAKGGVGLEADLPYDPGCVCVRIAPAISVASYVAHMSLAARKRAVSRGPVIGGFEVFEDFEAYASGVYHHVLGSLGHGHAVCIVGYDDADACWIAKNSWGVNFGEAGFFRIGYGECGLDTVNPFYEVETVALP